jgi:hypothetical protein
VQIEIERTGQGGLINDGAAHEPREHVRQLSNRRGAPRKASWKHPQAAGHPLAGRRRRGRRPAASAHRGHQGGAVGRGGVHLRAKLAVASRHDERVNWHLFGFAVHRQLEPLGQKVPQHHEHLGRRAIGARLRIARSLRDDVEPLGLNPFRAARDLQRG